MRLIVFGYFSFVSMRLLLVSVNVEEKMLLVVCI